MLEARMQRHGQEMMFLVVNLVILQREEAARAADEIAEEPRLARPATGDADSLNALLPKRFFELEDELRERARALSSAARAKDDSRLIAAYGQLTATCMSCHSLYLKGEGDGETLE
jgi:cytochrome c556